jgi:hypothetical protein
LPNGKRRVFAPPVGVGEPTTNFSNALLAESSKTNASLLCKNGKDKNANPRALAVNAVSLW